MAIDITRWRSHQTISTSALVLMVVIALRVHATTVPTQNQVIEHLKLLSESDDAGLQPSRLRAFLVNDLRKILVTNLPVKDDCTAETKVKVNTYSCNCNRFNCSSQRFTHQTKRSRFLIARSCEDICCRKRTITKKSASSDLKSYMNDYRHCEISNSTYNNGVNNLRIKSLVQIFSSSSKKFVCLGSLVHPKAVLTTLECVSTYSQDKLYVKMKETVDKFQNLYQIRNVTEILSPDNHMDRFAKLRSDMALLMLNKEMETNTQIGVSCLPEHSVSAQSLANRKCFVTSLEYVNGRPMERTESIDVLGSDQCRDGFSHYNRIKASISKQNICAAYSDAPSNKIKSVGASLICMHEQRDESGDSYQYYVLYGLNIGRTVSPALFTNIFNYRYWLEKRLQF